MEKKHIPMLVGSAAALAGVTLFSMCLCCGLGAWMFPPSKAAANQGRTREVVGKDATEQPANMVTAADSDRARFLEIVTAALRRRGDFPVLEPAKFELGQVAIVGLRLTVVQIIDERNMLVSIDPHVPGRSQPRPGPRLFWITGQPTQSLVDDAVLPRGDAFIGGGKREYQTVAGATKSVGVLRWVDPDLTASARKTLEAEKNP